MSCAVEGCDDILGVQTLGCGDLLGMKHTRKDHLVRYRETLHQLAFEYIPAKRIGTGLKHGPEAPAEVRRAQRAQCLANRSGMVSKVVDDGDTVHFGSHLQPTPHALESGKSL